MRTLNRHLQLISAVLLPCLLSYTVGCSYPRQTDEPAEQASSALSIGGVWGNIGGENLPITVQSTPGGGYNAVFEQDGTRIEMDFFSSDAATIEGNTLTVGGRAYTYTALGGDDYRIETEGVPSYTVHVPGFAKALESSKLLGQSGLVQVSGFLLFVLAVIAIVAVVVIVIILVQTGGEVEGDIDCPFVKGKLKVKVNGGGRSGERNLPGGFCGTVFPEGG